MRRVISGAEAAQVAVDRFAVVPDCGLVLFTLERQPPATGDGAKHHRVDDRAALPGERIHVDEQSVFRIVLDDFGQLVLIETPVTHGDLFIHGIEAAERSDHMRSLARDKSVRHSAAGFEQFAGHRDIDIADAGRQRQHGTPAAKLA